MKKLLLNGFVGGWEFNSEYVSNVLQGMPSDEDLVVRITSPGGIAYEGVAIYNALAAHEGRVTVYVDGLAASAASIIAMAGDETIMSLGSMMMVHNPWLVTLGDASEHRKSAEMLDKHAEALTDIYTKKTGMSRQDVFDLMEDETWLTSEDAVAFGFADSEDDEAEETAEDVAAKYAKNLIKFDMARMPETVHDRVVASLAPRAANDAHTPPDKGPQEDKMDKDEQQEVDLDQVKQEAAAAEKARAAGIRDVCARVGLADMADELISSDKSVDEARAAVIDALADQQAETPKAHKTSPIITQDSGDKFVEGAIQALSARAGWEARDAKNELNFATLKDLVRMSAERSGIKVRGKNPRRMVGEVLSQWHTTDHFPGIMEGMANKAIKRSLDEVEETFQRWTLEGSASDFKPGTRLGLGGLSRLRKVREAAEYKYVSLNEESEKVQVETYGEMFAITRQAIINDDMGVFTRIPAILAQAAVATVGDLVADILINGETSDYEMSDGVPLFDSSDHNNYDSSGTPLDLDNLLAAAMTLRAQTDASGRTLNIRPAYLIVPLALAPVAEALVGDPEYVDTSGGGPVTRKSPVYNLAEVIVDPRLDADSTDTWYLAARRENSAIEVTYLDGQKTPYLERQAGWNVDGVEYKVRLDVGASPIEYRTIYKAVG